MIDMPTAYLWPSALVNIVPPADCIAELFLSDFFQQWKQTIRMLQDVLGSR